MILLFNHIPVSLERKINELIVLAKNEYGSDFYNVNGEYWKGDDLTIQALFPNWVIEESEADPDNVTIVQIIKSYLRWLFSLEYGYGAYIEWESIHSPQKLNTKLLQGLADMYFPGADFTDSSVLSDLLPNLKRFAINVDANYFNKKGNPAGIKYLLTALLDLPQDACTVQTGSPGFIIVRANVPEKYKPFLNEHVYPAGTIILYENP